jgi:hypothetical protein
VSSEENREPAETEAEENLTDADEGEGEGEAKAKAETPAPKKKKAKAASGEANKDRNARIREEAAARRRDRREDAGRRAAPARNLDASEIVDDALARGTHNAALLLKKHFNKLQWVAVLIVVGGIGYKIWSVRSDRIVGDNSDKLLVAVNDERARVGEANSEPDRYSGLVDTRKRYADEAARLQAAANGYRAAAAIGGNTATLARLGEAGILYDQAKYKEALKAYQDVRDSELAGKDLDVKGRAIEGVGLSQEAQNELDAALKSFRELENSGISGFGPLGQFHQARIYKAKGDTEKAKELVNLALKKLDEKAKDRAPGLPPSYLQSAAKELLGVLDPQAAALSAMPQGMDPQALEKLRQETGKKQDIDPKKLEELLKQMQDAQKGMPAPPASAP